MEGRKWEGVGLAAILHVLLPFFVPCWSLADNVQGLFFFFPPSTACISQENICEDLYCAPLGSDDKKHLSRGWV